MFTKAWKVYGLDGHRQRESFSPSYTYDFSEPDNTRVITVQNSDKTGTNMYSVVIITRNTEEECNNEFEGQLWDGIFENSNWGMVEEISSSDMFLERCKDCVYLVEGKCHEWLCTNCEYNDDETEIHKINFDECNG